MFTFTIDPELRYSQTSSHPDAAYPELTGIASSVDPGNRVYGAVRDLIASSGWDAGNYGTAQWNPLRRFIAPGNNVVIKPNMVLHSVAGTPLEAIVTHATVVRVIADYALLALRTADGTFEGSVTIADVPLQSADFERICEGAGYNALMDYYQQTGLPVQLLDLRPHRAVIDDDFFILRTEPLPGDPRGSVVFDLGKDSAHYSPGSKREYSIQDYEDSATTRTHQGETHQYNIARTVLDADVIINIAKIKTHNKAGVTLSLKNFIGVNVSKDYLPHFTRGAPEDGGDEYAKRTMYNRATRYVRAFFQRNLSERWAPVWALLRKGARLYEKKRFDRYIPHGGGWYGNDTLWRTIIDVNRIVRFGRVDGSIADVPQRRVLCFGDGVTAGEGNGPLRNTAKHAGLLCMADNAVEMDANTAWVMGFDYRRIPHIANAVEALGDGVRPDPREDVDLGFEPAPGWKSHIERPHRAHAAA